jgi:hypothetical protein
LISKIEREFVLAVFRAGSKTNPHAAGLLFIASLRHRISPMSAAEIIEQIKALPKSELEIVRISAWWNRRFASRKTISTTVVRIFLASPLHTLITLPGRRPSWTETSERRLIPHLDRGAGVDATEKLLK